MWGLRAGSRWRLRGQLYIDSFCGSVIPKPLRSSGRHMYIRFQGDSENDTPRRGFKATFKVVKEFRK